MEAALIAEQYWVRQVVPGSHNRTLGGNRFEVNLSSPEAVAEFRASIAGSNGVRVGAILNFLGLGEPFNVRECSLNGGPLRLVRWLFNVLKQFYADLRTSAERGGAWVLNFTSLDGKFGLGRPSPLPLAQAATIGMFKTVAKEWPEVSVKSVDLDPDMDPQLQFSHIIEEIQSDDGLVEVGISDNARWRIALVNEARMPDKRAHPEFDTDSVVLVTGGARGITAEVTKHLAREVRPRLIIVGRTSLAADEPSETRGLADAASLRKHLIAAMRRDNPAVTPARVEESVREILKHRQICSNINELEQAGSIVEYHSLDVRDPEQFGALIDRVYQQYGRLDGVIHGAGIIEDKRIHDKTLDSFTKVFSTKVHSAIVLANKLRGDSLKFLVFFSSVSARFGNAGQIDYSAANEYLNKLAVHLDAKWPGRVVAIQWGPWEGGMVSEELGRLYAANGVRLIPAREGAEMLLSELLLDGRASPEVLIACNIQAIATARRGEVI
jgi:NAD(P)-dependent dehydrogenase (short-subunit alcohol dehydrogenase family)